MPDLPTPKPLYRSMTVWSSLLMLAGYFVAKYYFEASDGVIFGILAAGLLAIILYMRRALANLFEHAEKLRHAAPPSVNVSARSRRKRKSLLKSMTIWVALIGAAFYWFAWYSNAPWGLKEGVIVITIALVAVFMRRAVVDVFGDAPRDRRPKQEANAPQTA